jgi:hypothetical protein
MPSRPPAMFHVEHSPSPLGTGHHGDQVRGDRDRRRARRGGGRRGGRPRGCAHPAGDAEPGGDRPDELQPRHRRGREGYGGAGGGCARRHHGDGHGSFPHPVPHAEPLQRPRRVGAPRPVRPGTLPPRRPRAPRAAGEPPPRPGDGGGAGAGRLQGGGGPGGGRRDLPRARRRADGGHLPARADPRGSRSRRPRRTRGGRTVGPPGGADGSAGAGGRALQDRHSAAGRRPVGGPRPDGGAARRESGVPPLRLGARAPPPAAHLLDRLDRGAAHGHRPRAPRRLRPLRRGDRRPGSALLPVDRGQDRQVPGRRGGTSSSWSRRGWRPASCT